MVNTMDNSKTRRKLVIEETPTREKLVIPVYRGKIANVEEDGGSYSLKVDGVVVAKDESYPEKYRVILCDRPGYLSQVHPRRNFTESIVVPKGRRLQKSSDLWVLDFNPTSKEADLLVVADKTNQNVLGLSLRGFGDRINFREGGLRNLEDALVEIEFRKSQYDDGILNEYSSMGSALDPARLPYHIALATGQLFGISIQTQMLSTDSLEARGDIDNPTKPFSVSIPTSITQIGEHYFLSAKIPSWKAIPSAYHGNIGAEITPEIAQQLLEIPIEDRRIVNLFVECPNTGIGGFTISLHVDGSGYDGGSISLGSYQHGYASQNNFCPSRFIQHLAFDQKIDKLLQSK